MGIKTVEIKYQPDTGKKPDFDLVSVLLIFVAIGIIIGAIYFIFSFRESEASRLIEAKSDISAILIENDSGKTLSVFISFFNSETGKLATIMIPENTRLKVDYEDKPAYDTIENIYFRGDAHILKNTLEKLTGGTFDFYMAYDLGDVETLVDLLEGVEIANPENLSYTDLDKKIFIRLRKGNILLDGAKAREFLFYRPGDEGTQITMDNHKIFIDSLIDRWMDIAEIIEYRRVFSRLIRNIDTNLTKKDLIILAGQMPKLNSSRILFYRMLGKNTVINDEVFLTPIDNGEWLRDRIEKLKKFLSDEGPAPIGDEINIEILNGSGNPGQAQSLRNYLLQYGFNVVHYGNALRNDYETTTVIDRIGVPSLAKRVADIINCKEVYTKIDKTLLVDVTIIIGNDFEGRSVR
jgi:anionic cell wall polymer biosynthesis LytR-Cps2A-Psr (LCP) family protein